VEAFDLPVVRGRHRRGRSTQTKQRLGRAASLACHAWNIFDCSTMPSYLAKSI
jgi:hypothetical protein